MRSGVAKIEILILLALAVVVAAMGWRGVDAYRRSEAERVITVYSGGQVVDAFVGKRITRNGDGSIRFTDVRTGVIVEATGAVVEGGEQ